MELPFMPAEELARMIKSKEVSPVELTEVFLKRIEELNPKLNAYLTVASEEALEEARRAEEALAAGKDLGPLHGVPVSMKDLNETRGLRTTYGSLIYKDFVPEKDSLVAQRLKAAGAVILGKTNTPEFGQSGTTENKLGDHCRNPWDPGRTTGGSSGGAAAAMAAGLCSLAQGSDGGGSIRIPSGFCGVYGIKPSLGRVPEGGPNAMPLFSQNGPITRYVRDAALMLGALAGPDPSDPRCIRTPAPDYLSEMDRPLPELKIAWSPDLGYAAVDPEVRSIAESAARVFEEMGHLVEERTPATGPPTDVFNPISLADLYATYEHLLDEHGDELMGYVRSMIMFGGRVTGAEYSRAMRLYEEFRAAADDFFEEYDLLMTPTLAVTAFPVGRRPTRIDGQEVSKVWGSFPFTVLANITGRPAASVPCGFSAGGLPVGLHIIGRIGDEVTILKASARFEEARPWTDRRPPVS